jgi:hypothetical protein
MRTRLFLSCIFIAVTRSWRSVHTPVSLLVYLPCVAYLSPLPGRKTTATSNTSVNTQPLKTTSGQLDFHCGHKQKTENMSRPSAKLCTECFPSALRAQRVRPATLRGARRSYTTERRVLNTPRRPHRSPSTCVYERMSHRLVSKARGLASVAEEDKVPSAPEDGPMKEYDVRVEEGRLRDDEYQRGKSFRLVRGT